MYLLSSYILLIFPLLTLLILMIGLNTQRKNYILAALWLSLIASILHYQTANGEILGSYFDYWQALIYSLNLIILLISLNYLIMSYSRGLTHQWLGYGLSMLSAILVTAGILLLANIWFNAWFLFDRMPNTPLFQVATAKKLPYCRYKYVFYKVTSKNKIAYMCPHHYGVLPSKGELDIAPNFLLRQLPIHLQMRFKRDNLDGVP